MVFIIASAIAGLAGAFYSHYISFIDPNSFNYNKSIQILSMSILGGMGSIPGSIIGAIILTALPEALRNFKLLRQIMYGVVIIVMVMFRPAGILGGISFKHILQQKVFARAQKAEE
jgi:branched-chain amino acid transport system permease protein